MTPRKFYGCSELQKLLPKNSNPRKNIIDSVNFFVSFLYCTNGRISQLKVEIEGVRKAP